MLSAYDMFLYHKKNIETMRGYDASWNQKEINEYTTKIKSIINDINKLLKEDK